MLVKTGRASGGQTQMAQPILRHIETLWGTHSECLAMLCTESNMFVLARPAFDDASLAPPWLRPRIYSRHNFANTGLWLSRADAVSYGGVSPTAFGIVLDVGLIKVLQTLESPFLILYHGTDEANYENILKHKLIPTVGQLGYGVYIGSFWKACRFACRTQEYVLRESPLVIRIFARNLKTRQYPSAFPCERKDCIDHDMIWRRGMAGQLLPGQYSDGKWITKNEEWVFNSDDVLLSDAVRIDIRSVNKPHYDPYQRNIQIL